MFFNRKKRLKQELIEWAFCIVVAYVIYLIVNYFFIAISGVKQTSMSPTAEPGEKIFIVRPVLFKEEIEFGDIITFVAPKFDSSDIDVTKSKLNLSFSGNSAIADYPNSNIFTNIFYDFMGIGKKSYIKRVIGVAGDHIEIKENGFVYRNDEKLIENYTKSGTTNIPGAYYDVIVPNGCVYVLGDNRLDSIDSRVFGCVPISKVDGYVKIRLWPFSKWGSLADV